MKVDFTYGVCLSNEDPQNLGRIRALPLTIFGNATNLSVILKNAATEDQKALSGGIYRPWQIFSEIGIKNPDPYVCQPFLPKNIGLLPQTGQLIKILVFDDLTKTKEYIGPYTIDSVTLREEFPMVIKNINKGQKLRAVLPQNIKIFYSGFNNEQLSLGDNEILMRLNYINYDKTKKTQYPFIQLSDFNKSYKYVDEITDERIEPDAPIDHICEMFLDYDASASKKYIVTLLLFNTTNIITPNGKIGLTQKLFDSSVSYINKNSGDFIVKHVISSKTLRDIIPNIKNIIDKYKKNIVCFYDNLKISYEQTITNANTDIYVYNKLSETPNIGGANMSELIIRNWYFYLNPNVKTSDYISLPNEEVPLMDEFIGFYNIPQKLGELQNQQTVVNRNQKTVGKLNSESLSALVGYADKIIFLSSLNNPDLITNPNSDNLSLKQISDIINNIGEVKTYGITRGEKMLELINDLLDVFLSHGHLAGVDPRSSLDGNTNGGSVKKISDLKQKIHNYSKINNDKDSIINHNFRID